MNKNLGGIYMKLITNEIVDKMPNLYDTEGIEAKNKVAQVKFFNPFGSGTWFGIEYDPNDRLFFGYVDLGYGGEWGYFSLNELEDIFKTVLKEVLQVPTKKHIKGINGMFLKCANVTKINVLG